MKDESIADPQEIEERLRDLEVSGADAQWLLGRMVLRHPAIVAEALDDFEKFTANRD